MVFGSGARADVDQRLCWVRIAAIAVALSINGLAMLYASLTPITRGPAHKSLATTPVLRRALIVEFVEATVVEPPDSRDPPMPQRESQRVSRSSLAAPVASSPAPEIASTPVPSPRLRLSLSGSLAIEAETPASFPTHDPNSADAVFYRRPAISYEATRFEKAWLSTSLAEMARQSTFSYARFCSLKDEMTQIRGCSREERNADVSALRGNRVDTAIRPDAAVD